MSAIATAAASIRSVRGPLQAVARRHYSSAIPTPQITAASGHSTQKLAIASGAAFVAGVDVTYAYFSYFKTDNKASA
ncbi:hypothetical protein BGZ98_008042 [Dissophora globulifera]|nr:hypothetical protein BGZ98_008042 [Dissophora globulifera]